WRDEAGGREVLAVAAEPGRRPVAGGLATSGGDLGPVDAVRAAEPRSIPVHPAAAPRRGGRLARAAAQRGRQRRHLGGANDGGAPGAVPRAPAEREARRSLPRRPAVVRAGTRILHARQR